MFCTSCRYIFYLQFFIFSPSNHDTSFENIVLISDRGLPHRVRLTDQEDCMIPKVAHYNYEYMKSIELINTFADVVTGTVTAINRFVEYILIIDFFHSEESNIVSNKILCIYAICIAMEKD